LRSLLIRAAAALAVVASAGCTATPPGPTAPRAVPPATAAAQRTADVGSAGRPIVMALVPSQDTARVAANGRAITAALEKATGLQWDVKVPASYAATIEGLCAGQIDIAWLAPIAVVAARSKNCAEGLLGALRTDPLTGRPAVTYQAQILVRSDGGIKALKDLKGKRVALVDRAAAPGTLSVAALVKKETGEDPRTFFSQTVYLSDDAKTVLAVYQGQVDGAASAIEARDQVERTFPDVKQRTTRIATAGPIPNDGIAVRRTLPADLRDRIAKALIDYAQSADGTKALRALYPIDGLDKIDPKLYDPLLDAARLMGVDLDKEIAATARPAATPTPSRAP
jgi:phosphonate transport system substrate-binding protein